MVLTDYKASDYLILTECSRSVQLPWQLLPHRLLLLLLLLFLILLLLLLLLLILLRPTPTRTPLRSTNCKHHTSYQIEAIFFDLMRYFKSLNKSPYLPLGNAVTAFGVSSSPLATRSLIRAAVAWGRERVLMGHKGWLSSATERKPSAIAASASATRERASRYQKRERMRIINERGEKTFIRGVNLRKKKGAP